MEKNQNISKGRLWTSYGLQGLASVMLLMGAVNNLMRTDMAVKGATDMGYADSSIFYLGLICLISVLLYAYPKTNILGAILITAWLGGAVATHMIHKDSLGMTFAPVIFGIIVWAALWLRDERLQSIFPFRS